MIRKGNPILKNAVGFLLNGVDMAKGFKNLVCIPETPLNQELSFLLIEIHGSAEKIPKIITGGDFDDVAAGKAHSVYRGFSGKMDYDQATEAMLIKRKHRGIISNNWDATVQLDAIVEVGFTKDHGNTCTCKQLGFKLIQTAGFKKIKIFQLLSGKVVGCNIDGTTEGTH